MLEHFAQAIHIYPISIRRGRGGREICIGISQQLKGALAADESTVRRHDRHQRLWRNQQRVG